MKVLAVGATHSRELKPFIATVRRSHNDFQSNSMRIDKSIAMIFLVNAPIEM